MHYYLYYYMDYSNVFTQERKNHPGVTGLTEQDPSAVNHKFNPHYPSENVNSKTDSTRILTFSSAQERSKTTRRTRRPSICLKKAMLAACRCTVLMLAGCCSSCLYSSFYLLTALVRDKMHIALKTYCPFPP